MNPEPSDPLSRLQQEIRAEAAALPTQHRRPRRRRSRSIIRSA
jgi:hypothetical protein